MKTKVKTIDIQAKEWFDKINGNSYFSSVITINFGSKDEVTLKLPFQYGYEMAYQQQSLAELFKIAVIKHTSTHLLREQGIIINSSIQRGCLKKQVVNHGL